MAWLTRLLMLLLLIVLLSCGQRVAIPAAPLPGSLRLWQDASIFSAVEALLDGARRRVWVEMYEFDRRDLEAALGRARRAGADVRVITDPSVAESVRAARRLGLLGVPVRFYPLDDRRHQIDHVKLLLTDLAGLVGGMNWGLHSDRNHDYALEIRPPPLLGRLQAIFEQDWSLAGGSPRPLAASLGPVLETAPGEEIRVALQEAIAAARSEVRAEVFALTDPDVIAGLAAARRRGAAVRLLLDPGQDVNRATWALLRAAGVAVRWFPAPVGSKLHAKVGLFDDRLLLGSANWSISGLSVNHELDLETDDKEVTSAFRARFDADWAAAPP